MISIEEELRIIAKGVAEIIDTNDLKRKLQQSRTKSRPLVVKLGLDPSMPDIHIGHAVVLRKLKQLQDLGHQAVIIIGDFTGMIGDPTGKSKTRKQLTREQVLENARTHEEQILKILNPQQTEVVFNGEWLSKLNFRDVIDLVAKCTVARMLERDDFENRFQNHQEIGLHEFFYPLMQGYDSVSIKADIELGGTDQRFNILMGRTLQKDYDQEPQVALFMPLLEGTDGVEKMSKSLGNYIGIHEEPEVIYGKVMSIPDKMIIKYYELTTDIHPDQIKEIKVALTAGTVNPRDIKMSLAREIVSLYHGDTAAAGAEEHFKTVFQKKEIPDNIPKITIHKATMINEAGEIDLIELLFQAKLIPTKSEGRRLINQGAVKINGTKISVLNIKIEPDSVIQVGKMKFAKVVFI